MLLVFPRIPQIKHRILLHLRDFRVTPTEYSFHLSYFFYGDISKWPRWVDFLSRSHIHFFPTNLCYSLLSSKALSPLCQRKGSIFPDKGIINSSGSSIVPHSFYPPPIMLNTVSCIHRSTNTRLGECNCVKQ